MTTFCHIGFGTFKMQLKTMYQEESHMSNPQIVRKEGFRFVGFKTRLDGPAAIHADSFSGQKTAFFKDAIQSGKMAQLQPLSESKYGFAAVTLDADGACYYAGVQTSRPAVDGEVSFPSGDYLVLAGKGGLSRLAFDRLENEAFNEILPENGDYAYNGGPVAEVLLNGNPMDAEVEVWIPVQPKS
jgi:predicted transcriptional regulator YdeE